MAALIFISNQESSALSHACRVAWRCGRGAADAGRRSGVGGVVGSRGRGGARRPRPRRRVWPPRDPAAGATMDGGVTPLMLSAHFGHASCVRLLVAAGADTTAVTTAANEMFKFDVGASALTLACAAGHSACISLVHPNE